MRTYCIHGHLSLLSCLSPRLAWHHSSQVSHTDSQSSKPIFSPSGEWSVSGSVIKNYLPFIITLWHSTISSGFSSLIHLARDSTKRHNIFPHILDIKTGVPTTTIEDHLWSSFPPMRRTLCHTYRYITSFYLTSSLKHQSIFDHLFSDLKTPAQCLIWHDLILNALV